MGFFDFVKDAGEKMLGLGGDDKDKKPGTPAIKDVKQAPAVKTAAQVNQEMAKALTTKITMLGLKVEELKVEFDNGMATLHGRVPNQGEKERAILILGNTRGVERVNDQLTVDKPEPEAKMYTVKSGDSLSKIAKAHYGDAMKYPVIFEANKPMLKDPNKIYPGQVLRIPPLDA